MLTTIRLNLMTGIKSTLLTGRAKIISYFMNGM